MPTINPRILEWARTTAGLSLADAAKGIFDDAHGKTGAQRLAELEAGHLEPSRPILRKLAKKYNRPVVVFYLEKPPKRSNRGEDFRTRSRPVNALHDANLDTLLRKVKASQEIVRDLLQDEEVEPLKFVGSATMDQDPKQVADDIVTTIGFDIKQFRAFKQVSVAFEYLRNKAQDVGIFVILAKNVGSHQTQIPLDVFRGFVIADDIAPFVVINTNDAVSARSFTLLHELAHLWLGTTGISGDIRAEPNNETEKYCNRVAAQILVAQEEINQLNNVPFMGFDEVVDTISKFAEDRNISRSMIAYKLLIDGRISNQLWQRLSEKFYEEWREIVKQQKEKEDRGSGGPSYYQVQGNRLGRELTGLASRALSSGSLTPSKASVVLLGVKLGNVHKLVSHIQPRGI